MNASFARLMDQATRLTRCGKLQAATAAIQAALNGRAGSAPPGAARHPPPSNDRAWVIDIEAREIVVPEAVPQPDEARRHGRFIDGTFTHASAGTRDYKLYVPPRDDGRTPLPLVVMLHGCTQDPDDFAAGTGMNEAARERGCFVLYPAQAQKAHPSRCWKWFKHNHQQRGRGEPALLAGMTLDVMHRHAVDPQRVYVAGLSAGGAMAAILGQTYPEIYAAVGVHSGLAAGAAHDLQSAFEAMRSGSEAHAAGSAHNGSAVRTPPTIVFHGDHDTVVHPINGEHAAAAARQDDAAAPAAEERTRSIDGRAYTRRRYRNADGRVNAEHWVVHGTGHAWSGGNAAGSHTDVHGPRATDEMLRFFFEQPGPAR